MPAICRAVTLTIGFALIASSQVERASIVGTLRDASGSVVPGVTVRVINEGTNTTTTLTTDAAGEYSASKLVNATSTGQPLTIALNGLGTAAHTARIVPATSNSISKVSEHLTSCRRTRFKCWNRT